MLIRYTVIIVILEAAR